MASEWIAESAFVSHEGAVRPHNEDAWCARDEITPELGLWAVADGMGGHEAGDVAAQLIVDRLEDLAATPRPDGFAAAVTGALERANGDLVALSKGEYQGRTIGSTIVALTRAKDAVRVVWAGDSRAYRMRDRKLEPLTRDHSRVEEMVARGALTREEARNHAQANIITRALGAAPQIELDHRKEALADGDLFLLCSDGLTAMASDEEISLILPRGAPDEIASALVHLCLGRGARDNVTVGVIRFRKKNGGARRFGEG